MENNQASTEKVTRAARAVFVRDTSYFEVSNRNTYITRIYIYIYLYANHK